MIDHGVQIGVFVASPGEVDNSVPGQPEEPAPEGNAPRFVSRQRFQGLDEDELRQVLRVRRAVDTADDVAVDRKVEVVEELAKGRGIS